MSVGLLLIDVQVGFDDPYWGERNQPDAEARLAGLLTAWRASGKPVFHAQHASIEPESPLRPDRLGFALKEATRPLHGEPCVVKSVNSAFIGTNLEALLREQGIEHLVVGGLTTNHCVSTTVRMAANLGFRVSLLSDGTATFGRTGPDGTYYDAETMHRTALASLHHEFATVITVDDARRLLER